MPDNDSQYVKLPDGSYGQFPTGMKDEDITAAISKNFPPTQPDTSHASGTHKSVSEMIGEGEQAQGEGQERMAKEHPGLLAGAGLLGAAAPLGAMAFPEEAATVGKAVAPYARQAATLGKTIAYMKGGQMIGKALGLPYGDLAGLILGGRGGESPNTEAIGKPIEPAPEEGVRTYPEPREPVSGIPNNMGSVPREQLPEMANRRVPGAAQQEQSLGKPIIYEPTGTGFPVRRNKVK